MEVPLDQARLIRQIISGFAVRLKTLEIAVQKAVSILNSRSHQEGKPERRKQQSSTASRCSATKPLRKAENLDDSVGIATHRNHRDNPVARRYVIT